jgi:hypothetical protein
MLDLICDIGQILLKNFNWLSFTCPLVTYLVLHGLNHGCPCIALDRGVPIRVEVRPKPWVGTLLKTLIHGLTMQSIDCSLRSPLGILLRHAVGALNRRVDLVQLMLFFIFIVGV